jgi:hypothetical protein
VRLVTVTGCGTRGIADAAFGPRKGKGSSEQDLAKVIAARGRLGPGMLVIADRAFCGYPVVSALTATGADVLIRAKSSQWLPVAEALPDGSYRSVLPCPAAAKARRTRNAMRRARGSALGPDTRPVPGIPVRVIDADITISPASGPPRTERCRLITTLASPAQAPAAQVAACYAQRWEIETSYREMKVFTRGPRRVLRSQHPTGITQEIWALLCACQLTHTARARAAAAAGHDPDRISYTVTLRAIRRALIAASNPAAITTEALAALLPPHRRHRSYPRLTRTSTGRRRTARATSTPATTYKITITAPAHTPHLRNPP